MSDAHQRSLARLRLAGIGELRVVVGELAIVQLRVQLDRSLRIFWNLHAIVCDVGGAGRNQSHIQHAARLQGIALVDRVAFTIELIRTIKMRAPLYGALAVVVDAAAPENRLARRILPMQLQPDVEGVDGSRGKEVTDLRVLTTTSTRTVIPGPNFAPARSRGAASFPTSRRNTLPDCSASSPTAKVEASCGPSLSAAASSGCPGRRRRAKPRRCQRR